MILIEYNYDNFTTNKRRNLIIKRLINGEKISYQRLSEEFFVSRSSIANDIILIKKIFSKEELSLTFDNSGTYFNGSELDIQRVLKRLILNNIEQLDNISDVINIDLLHRINQSFSSAIVRKSIDIPDSYITSIVVSILLIIDRPQKFADLVLDNKGSVNQLYLEVDQYPLVYELLKEVEREHIYEFSPEEVHYLTSLIIGSGLKFFSKEKDIPESFREKIKELIQRISESIQKDLTQDKRLEEDLIVHLYQLILRIEAKSTIVNPLVNEIKRKYSSVYGVVWFTLNDFIKTFNVNLSEDEVGFIVIHVQASIERIKKKNRILFVCPNGIGMSSFISAKIRKILPEVNYIEIISERRLYKSDLSDVDFIISTIDISIKEKKVVQISPLVTIDDLKKIMNLYIDLILVKEEHCLDNYHESPKLLNNSHNNIIFGHFKGKQEALNYLIEKQKFRNKDFKQLFLQSVFDREEQQSTYLDNGFAIPHGSPKFVERSSINILILDKPIDWGNQKVDIIILLMIKENDLKRVEEMMDIVMKGIKDKEWFISKMLEVKE